LLTDVVIFFDYDYIQVLVGFASWLWASASGSGCGLRASGFGALGALGLHVFGVEVASCIYSGNGGNYLGNIFFPFVIMIITHMGREGRV
jgi:hypothetical protein